MYLENSPFWKGYHIMHRTNSLLLTLATVSILMYEVRYDVVDCNFPIVHGKWTLQCSINVPQLAFNHSSTSEVWSQEGKDSHDSSFFLHQSHSVDVAGQFWWRFTIYHAEFVMTNNNMLLALNPCFARDVFAFSFDMLTSLRNFIFTMLRAGE